MKFNEILVILVMGLFVFNACNDNKDQDQGDTSEEMTEDTSMNQFNDTSENIEVTDADMDKMMELMDIFQPLSEEAEAKMIQAVESEGLDVNSFSEIQMGMMNPEADAEVSEEDMAKFSRASEKVEAIQMESQSKFEEILSENDMTPEQYQAIFMAIQSDPELMDKFMKKMGIDTEQEQF